MAFVLIAYPDPTHDSLMAELLARQTPMPVREAKAHTATEWVLVEQKNRN
jgi:hypothetical protein